MRRYQAIISCGRLQRFATDGELLQFAGAGDPQATLKPGPKGGDSRAKHPHRSATGVPFLWGSPTQDVITTGRPCSWPNHEYVPFTDSSRVRLQAARSLPRRKLAQ